jgi:DNA-binding transcriptional MerR regulator
MFTIGDFARLGHVSVRMLRHYDSLGLLRPAHIDPATGYRSYEAAQLGRLNRLIALKELGFSLDQVGAILGEEVGAAELRGMLLLRRAELRERIAADTDRLASVESRLTTIEQEGTMPSSEVTVKPVPAVRIALLTAVAPGYGHDQIGPVVGPLFEQLMERVPAAGLTMTGPGIATYADNPDGDGVLVTAGVTVGAEPGEYDGLSVAELPALEQAATLIHHGAMTGIGASVQALARWIEGGGWRVTGVHREVYLNSDGPQEGWVTELQEPVEKVAG